MASFVLWSECYLYVLEDYYRSLHCSCWKEHVFDDIMFIYVTGITECYTFWQEIHSSCPRMFTALAKYS